MDRPTIDIQQVIEHQRASIAGEIHDTLMPYLFATRMRLETLLNQRKPDDVSATRITEMVREEITKSIETVCEAMAIGRQMIGELHSADVTEISWSDQMDATIERLCVPAGTRVTVQGDFDAIVNDTDRRLAARRIAQESIRNAIRHGRAATVLVQVQEQRDQQVLLSITDDGRGFDSTSKSRGHGLRIMGARAKSIGGKLTVDSRTGGPTRIELVCDR